jgi:hypothetical protein
MLKSRVKPTLQALALAVAALHLVPICAAEPPAEPVRAAEASGIDFSRPVSVTFEWKPSAPHPSEEVVRQALQSQGFAWARAESRESQQSTAKVSISVTRSGQQAPGALSAIIKSVSGLASGQGAQSWSITQQR